MSNFLAGLQFDGIFRLGSFGNSGEPTIVAVDGIRKKSIVAHPPPPGLVKPFFSLCYLLPQAREVIFSFSMGLQDGCSDGVFFKVLVNGETQFEHFTDTFRWEDANISLSRYAGDYMCYWN